MRYHFATDKFIRRGDTHFYDQVTFDGEGPDPESAAVNVKHLIPDGHFIMAWWETGPGLCSHVKEEP